MPLQPSADLVGLARTPARLASMRMTAAHHRACSCVARLQQACRGGPNFARSAAAVPRLPVHAAHGGMCQQRSLLLLLRLTRPPCRCLAAIMSLQGLQLAAETADQRAERALIRVRARALRETGAPGGGAAAC